MNKAFVREPEQDGRGYCPHCGSLGVPVHTVTLDHQVRSESRVQLGESAWFCTTSACDIAYFDQFERFVSVDELQACVYPKHADAPVCACFGFTIEDIEADVQAGTPVRIRELLAKSQSSEAQCAILAADGRCCMREVQRLYFKWTADLNPS